MKFVLDHYKKIVIQQGGLAFGGVELTIGGGTLLPGNFSLVGEISKFLATWGSSLQSLQQRKTQVLVLVVRVHLTISRQDSTLVYLQLETLRELFSSSVISKHPLRLLLSFFTPVMECDLYIFNVKNSDNKTRATSLF